MLGEKEGAIATSYRREEDGKTGRQTEKCVQKKYLSDKRRTDRTKRTCRAQHKDYKSKPRSPVICFACIQRHFQCSITSLLQTWFKNQRKRLACRSKALQGQQKQKKEGESDSSDDEPTQHHNAYSDTSDVLQQPQQTELEAASELGNTRQNDENVRTNIVVFAHYKEIMHRFFLTGFRRRRDRK